MSELERMLTGAQLSPTQIGIVKTVLYGRAHISIGRREDGSVDLSFDLILGAAGAAERHTHRFDRKGWASFVKSVASFESGIEIPNAEVQQ